MKPEVTKKYHEILTKADEHLASLSASHVAIHETFRMMRLYTNMVAEERDELKGRIVRLGIIMEGVGHELMVLDMTVETRTRIERLFHLWHQAIAGHVSSEHGTA